MMRFAKILACSILLIATILAGWSLWPSLSPYIQNIADVLGDLPIQTLFKIIIILLSVNITISLISFFFPPKPKRLILTVLFLLTSIGTPLLTAYVGIFQLQSLVLKVPDGVIRANPIPPGPVNQVVDLQAVFGDPGWKGVIVYFLMIFSCLAFTSMYLWWTMWEQGYDPTTRIPRQASIL